MEETDSRNDELAKINDRIFSISMLVMPDSLNVLRVT